MSIRNASRVAPLAVALVVCAWLHRTSAQGVVNSPEVSACVESLARADLFFVFDTAMNGHKFKITGPCTGLGTASSSGAVGICDDYPGKPFLICAEECRQEADQISDECRTAFTNEPIEPGVTMQNIIEACESGYSPQDCDRARRTGQHPDDPPALPEELAEQPPPKSMALEPSATLAEASLPPNAPAPPLLPPPPLPPIKNDTDSGDGESRWEIWGVLIGIGTLALMAAGLCLEICRRKHAGSK